MKTILQDLDSPLNKIERWWIRKPFTIAFTIICLVFVVPIGILDAFITLFDEFIIPCWKGE